MVQSFLILLFCVVAKGFEIVAKLQNPGNDGQGVDGLKLRSIHEGAGIEYAFLGDDGRDFSFNDTDNSLYFPIQAMSQDGNTTLQMVLSIDLDGNGNSNSAVVEFTLGGASYVSIDDEGLVRVKNSNAFFACKNIPELAGYTNSVQNWAVLLYPYGGAPDTCVYIKLVADGFGSSNSTSTNLTSMTSSMTSSSLSSIVSSSALSTSSTPSISTDLSGPASSNSDNMALINGPSIPLILALALYHF